MYWVIKELDCSTNLKKACVYLDQLVSDPDLITLVSHKLCYKLLLKGEGELISSKVSHVSFHYSISDFEGKIYDAGTVKKEGIEHLIPGVDRSLIGMKRGESRQLYMHPEYAYGKETYLSPNIGLIAKMQVIDFEDGEDEAVLFSPHRLEEKKFEDLWARYQQLQSEQFYRDGIDFWDSMIKNNQNISFVDFKENFNKFRV